MTTDNRAAHAVGFEAGPAGIHRANHKATHATARAASWPVGAGVVDRVMELELVFRGDPQRLIDAHCRAAALP